MARNKIDRRVDAAMQKATIGLLVPISQLVAMGKLCRQALEGAPDMSPVDDIAKCRAIMIQQGAEVVS